MSIRIHDEYEVATFDAQITDDGSAATIRFVTASDHEAIVTMSAEVLGQLVARLTELVFDATPSSEPQ